MKARIVKHRKADNDLIGHFVYICKDSRRTAERFLQAAERAFQKLAKFP